MCKHVAENLARTVRCSHVRIQKHWHFKQNIVKLQEDTIDIQDDSEIGGNILGTCYTNKNKAKTSSCQCFV
jgi:hypothetical protein